MSSKKPSTAMIEIPVRSSPRCEEEASGPLSNLRRQSTRCNLSLLSSVFCKRTTRCVKVSGRLVGEVNENVDETGAKPRKPNADFQDQAL
jgi:hypothetical protein